MTVQAFDEQEALAEELAVTAQLLRRSTVHVRSGRMGGGSGVVWSPEGLIITNAHVARGPQAEVELWDGQTFQAEVTARDQGRDLASLQVQGAADFPSAPIANSDELRVGQLVVAVGNPLGLSGALTMGIIHALAPAEGRGRQTWVQADLRLAPGNSGGPLADVTGSVIGINSMVSGGLGLAVPSNAVEWFLGNQGSRPQLGVTMQPVVVPVAGRHGDRPGLLVLDVAAGSAAERAGVMVGDILIGVDGYLFEGPNDLLSALQGIGTKSVMQLELLRGGTRVTREAVLLGNREASKGAAA